MCPPWAAPPAAHPCLSRPYSSRPNQKGGSRIADAVLTVAMHVQMLLSPAQYRPESCRCGSDCLHFHDRRERHPRGLVADGQAVPVVTILVFRCADCGATWRVLPAFLARCLWRPWEVVEREVQDQPRPRSAPAVPARTVQRWRSRLAQSARLLVQVLVVAGGRLRELAGRVPLEPTRGDLLAAFDLPFAVLAALLHSLAPGVRVM